ncbi:MAG: ABC transporter permease, partial [Actinomycetota bacterium]
MRGLFGILRGSPMVMAGAIIVAVMISAAVLAPVLAPYDPYALAGDSLESPSGSHLLGTNNVGQDLLSQLIWGARESLFVALAGAAAAVAAAIAIGVAPEVAGGWAALIASRGIDLLLAIPGLPLVLLVATLAGPNRAVMVAVIALAGAPAMARVLAVQTRTLRRRGFISAATGMGAGPGYLVRRHLVPGLGPLLVTRFVEWAGIAVLLQAGLAFLGLSDPTGVSWGLMLNRATE